MNPSSFLTHPYDSILKKHEAANTARNIMVILNRTGNKFRKISWDEYKQQRLTDGNFSPREQYYFDQVIGLLQVRRYGCAF